MNQNPSNLIRVGFIGITFARFWLLTRLRLAPAAGTELPNENPVF